MVESKIDSNSTPLYQPIGDGLLLRQATLEDKAKIAEFQNQILGADSKVEIEALFEGVHSGSKAEDFLVIVDQDERIISSLALLEVEWRVGQTRLRIGQPEFVGTLAEYRGRGLVRQQFDIIHSWMQKRGLAFAVIGGISYYYRLYGYEYALDIYRAGLLTAEQPRDLIQPPPGVEVRLASENDAPALTQLQRTENAQVDIAMDIPEKAWQWTAQVRRLDVNEAEDWVAVQAGQVIGTARIIGKLENLMMHNISGNQTAVVALVAHALRLPGLGKLRIGARPDSTVGRWVARFETGNTRPYAWYMRVNDPLLAFQQLSSEFERRIATSAFAGLNRELELGFFRFGIKLTFADGKIMFVERLPGQQSPKIGIPPDLLPKLLFGYRDIDQLANLYPDFFGDDDWQLLKVLFPALTNNIRFLI